MVGTALAFFRVPPPDRGILWAEDGATFVSEAYGHNPLVLFEPYSGYLHIFPRLGAALATLFPVDLVPMVVTVIAALLTGAVATAVYLFARLRLHSHVLPVVLWLDVAILPVAGGEVTDSIANSHWYLIFGALWAVLVTPRSTRLIVLQGIVLAFAILSDPLTLVATGPFVLIRIFSLPRWRAQVVTIVYLSAAVVQGIGTVAGTVFGHGRTVSGSLPLLPGFLEIYGSRVTMGSVVGINGTTVLLHAFGIAALIAMMVLVFVAISAVIIVDAHRRTLVLAFSATSLVLSVLTFTLVWGALDLAGPLGLEVGGRYMVVPTLCLFSAIILSFDSLLERMPHLSARTAVAAALLVAVAVIGAQDYRVWTDRAEAPRWSDSLDDATLACSDGGATGGLAAIAPVGFAPVGVPCDVLLGRHQ